MVFMKIISFEKQLAVCITLHTLDAMKNINNTNLKTQYFNISNNFCL